MLLSLLPVELVEKCIFLRHWDGKFHAYHANLLKQTL